MEDVSLASICDQRSLLTPIAAKQDGILGFHYWKEPGATTTWLRPGKTGRFIALMEVVVLSAFPFVSFLLILYSLVS